MNLETFESSGYRTQSQRSPYTWVVKGRWIEALLMILGPAGVFVAGVLSVGHALNLKVPCGPQSGCDVVSPHSSAFWFGVPVAYFGLAGYLALTVLAALLATQPTHAIRLRKVGLAMSGFGVGTSAWLTYTALSVIKARCDWCLASAAIMTLTFVGYGVLCLQKSKPEKRHPWGLTVLGAGVFLALAGVGLQGAEMKKAADQPGQITPAVALTVETLAPRPEYFLGPPEAPITIVEYADFYCPACREMYLTMKSIYDQGRGYIRIAYRHLPFFEKAGHEQALTAAVIAEYAATQGKYWDWIEAVFTAPLESINTYPKLLALAKKIGLNEKELAAKIESEDKSLLQPIETDIANARKMRVDSTPSFVIFAEGVETVGVRMNKLVETLGQPEYQKLINPSQTPGPVPSPSPSPTQGP